MKKAGNKLQAALAGAMAGGMLTGVIFKKRTETAKKMLEKSQRLYMVFDRWLMLKQQGKSLKEFFIQNHYRTVAIYGMRELGERLYDELKDSGITVKYAIDKNADAVYTEVDVVTPEECMEHVDVIVVTAVYYFDEVKETLGRKVDYDIVSLEEIIRETELSLTGDWS